jgi:hypothetical protein
LKPLKKVLAVLYRVSSVANFSHNVGLVCPTECSTSLTLILSSPSISRP